VPEPKLYAQYDRQEAIRFFGMEANARILCDGQWIIFPDVAICLTTLGARPQTSYFQAGTQFYWVADKPYRVATGGRHPASIPTEVIGGNAKGLVLHLFVCRHDSHRYQYLGRLQPSYVQQFEGSHNHGEARFQLSPALPSALWAELGGLRAGDDDYASVDVALDCLRGSTTVEDRFWVLQQLTHYWHGPIRSEDGMTPEELKAFRLPLPLLWWYGWAGNRAEIMSGQNFLFSPKDDFRKLRVEEGRLLFYIENQAVYEWATLPDGSDPPVFGPNRGSWQPEDISLSEHLIAACLFEAVIFHSPYGASTSWLEQEKFDRIVETVPPLAIGTWRWPEATRFYAGGGAFMYACKNRIRGETAFSIWIGAKTEHPLQFLKPYLDEHWEYVAV